ncbi:MAG: 8-amino-7-oxononanoate synthase [Rhodospirillaceae bacterium]|nr:MAG: 8-amino-7-oxononanoate synthase [Rhodospirillaceae bacterium]
MAAPSSLDIYAQTKLANLEATHLRRTLAETAREDGVWVTRNGRRLLSFSCNDYLNLTHHPAVKEAAIAAVQQYGVGAGASRLVTGNHPLFTQLEARLAALKETEAACVFGSGYLANTGIIPALIGRNDLVLVDKLAHACIWDGARLSGAPVVEFRHNDVVHVEQLLTNMRAKYRHVLIATDGVFSMDGDLAPLHDLAGLAERFDAWLMTDDAHGLGVVGGGRGSTFASGRKVEVALQMGTLSKALGGYGAYICGSQPVIDLIRTRARTLIYSTGLPPAIVAAAMAALDVIAGDPALAARPVQKAQAFTRQLNLPLAESPIVPVVIGDALKTMEASRMLEEEGFLVAPIRPPTVPAKTARLRIAFTAAHPDDEIRRLADVIQSRVLGR